MSSSEANPTLKSLARQRALSRLATLRRIGSPVWAPHPENRPQNAAFESEADETLYGGAAGGGKALAANEKIVTPFGFREIGSLSVGDTICAADGTPTRVIGVYPQGVRPLYRVTFQDGASVLADGDHRWKYSVARRQWRKSGREWKIGTTRQLAALLDDGGRPLIPLAAPLKFTKAYKTAQRRIEPYALGLLLGDGYTKQAGPGAKWSFSTGDEGLVDALPGDWVPDGDIDYRLRGAERRGLMEEFGRLGLSGCGAEAKFIPEPYKWAPVSERLALLQGLMDTDGTIDDRGHASFCSCSERLADDVVWLVRTLGGRAAVTRKETTHRDAFTVYIRIAESGSLFRLDRKSDRGSTVDGKRVKRRIVSIDYERDGEAVCIAVDHPDSLYVVGEGCIVTHNSDLLLGTALTRHRKSIVFRKRQRDAKALIDRTRDILGDFGHWNAHDRAYTTNDGRELEFGHCSRPGDEQSHQGRPRDCYGFDELAQFTEYEYTFITGWLRSTDPNQRKRVIAASNPPMTAEGHWLIRRWAPWLDHNHPNPAKHGELRWFATIDGRDTEVAGPEPFEHTDASGATETITPRSRTFIFASLEDNPFYRKSGYRAVLQALQEPMRSALLKGDFASAMEDDAWQVIPTAWVEAAMARWKPGPPEGVPMSAAGVDVARGGRASTVVSRRHGAWFDELLSFAGTETDTGVKAAARVLTALRDGAPAQVDIIGVGASCYDHLKQMGVPVAAMDARRTTELRDRSGRLGMYNERAAWWWGMREALDPETGDDLALPPDTELRADLTAPTWEPTPRGVKVEAKEDIEDRLQRSVDKGDAVVMARPQMVDPLPVSQRRRGRMPATAEGDYDPLRH